VRECHHSNLGIPRFEGLNDNPRLRVADSIQEPNDEARFGHWVGKSEAPTIVPSPSYELAVHCRSQLKMQRSVQVISPDERYV